MSLPDLTGSARIMMPLRAASCRASRACMSATVRCMSFISWTSLLCHAAVRCAATCWIEKHCCSLRRSRPMMASLFGLSASAAWPLICARRCSIHVRSSSGKRRSSARTSAKREATRCESSMRPSTLPASLGVSSTKKALAKGGRPESAVAVGSSSSCSMASGSVLGLVRSCPAFVNTTVALSAQSGRVGWSHGMLVSIMTLVTSSSAVFDSKYSQLATTMRLLLRLRTNLATSLAMASRSTAFTSGVLGRRPGRSTMVKLLSSRPRTSTSSSTSLKPSALVSLMRLMMRSDSTGRSLTSTVRGPYPCSVMVTTSWPSGRVSSWMSVLRTGQRVPQPELVTPRGKPARRVRRDVLPADCTPTTASDDMSGAKEMSSSTGSPSAASRANSSVARRALRCTSR
mmetsp:Transcript_9940/g.33787  ORF Transcript_9940/g.33787 Transcript_9940/m.33787 type:complete len:401 (+) Transcript_9940:1936-3138(+)